MPLYDKIRDLPVDVRSYSLEPFVQSNPGGFERLTTVIQFEGGGHIGRGEETTYSPRNQRSLQSAGANLELAGSFTLHSFSEFLDSLDLWPDEPEQSAYRDYRRWAYESAALNLALSQAGLMLSEALSRPSTKANFVVSTGLGSPPSLERIEELLRFEPRLRFKLDTSNDWDDEFIAKLAALSRVDVVDFKGAYVGTVVDQIADPELYLRVINGMPDVLLEDPHSLPAISELLGDHWARVTWDAPIHSSDDVAALEVRPQVINAKPSRCGTLRRLFEFYDYCEAQGIALYGGGQFELADGRELIQDLAGIFHPNAPNDIGPIEFNRPVLSRPISDERLAYLES